MAMTSSLGGGGGFKDVLEPGDIEEDEALKCEGPKPLVTEGESVFKAAFEMYSSVVELGAAWSPSSSSSLSDPKTANGSAILDNFSLATLRGPFSLL